MPDDLRQAIIDAIAGSGDENFKRLLLLMLRVEEVFIARVEELAEQMTVPPAQHKADHDWVYGTREMRGGIKSAIGRLAFGVVEKCAYAGAGALAVKLFGA